PPISLVGDDLDSDFPKLDDELPSLDDETPEPDTIDNGMDNLDSEFPSLDNDLPTMDEEMPSLDDEVPNLDDDQTDTSSDGNMDDFNLSAADGLDTSPYNDDSNDEPSAEDFESAAAAAANENFDMPDDFTLADNPPPDEFSSAADDFDTAADDNPTPLEVPLTATAQRPVRTRREAAPANDSDLSLDHKRRGLPVWLRIVLILVSLAALLGLAFVVFRCVADRTPPIPDATALQPLPPLVVPTLPPLTPPPVTTPAVTTPPPETTPAVTTPPVATTPVVTPAVSAETTPPETTAPRGDRPPTTPREPGVWYRLRWGDTLWDLSNSYYRNPWQYMKIFRANPDIIVHPDRIIATTWIYIPK
ncbi:MAG TPA: hypothetical protein DCX65_08265, partial [Spirochaetaceae bacterium]|nr:hypothetical protein [Spirochaetaceae bacterium]